MGVIEFLEKLRNKPVPVRQAVALWTSLLITFIIVSFWLRGLVSNVAGNLAGEKQEPVSSPFATFKKNFADMLASVHGSFTYTRE